MSLPLPLPPTHVGRWIKQNSDAFKPPICNKLLYRGSRLSIMLVGGPNQRRDFHSEDGSEFFYQLAGRAEIVTVQQQQDGRGGSRLVPVPLGAGEMFLLPSRVPHSPQRAANSMGLVIERNRLPGEFDSLTWYKDSSAEIEFQRYFECRDLGKDLVPVVREYELFKTGGTGAAAAKLDNLPCSEHVPSARSVPMPIALADAVAAAAKNRNGGVFGAEHPDGEFLVALHQDAGEHELNCPAGGVQEGEEVFLFQLKGRASVSISSPTAASFSLNEGEACVVVLKPSTGPLRITREAGSLGLVVMIKDIDGNRGVAARL